ncbi:hypothetical protein [Bacillus sp. FJAT-28004]|uniref:hypothetical protein n=1 Tax=Bacillus sp. FJAT-28004 TaxID=1679165 RepID=UPI0006B51355|nr:hypothetical protein [Bacillus sp. FJAT-28004]
MKRGYIIVIGVVVVVAALFMFLFRVNEDQVIVERMLSFDQAEPSSQVVWKDRESIRAFEYAFRFGKRQPGKVDIDFPPYTVTLGEQRYFLYISEQYELGNFMKPGDTGTLYRIGKSSTEKIKALLKQAYSVSGSVTGGADERDVVDVSNNKDGEKPIPPSMSPSPIASEQETSSVEPSQSPNNQAYKPAYLDSSQFSDEEKPLIELINFRIKYMHEENWDGFLSLYTESVRKERENSGSFTGFTITSIKVEQPISIKEQKSLFEAVVQVIAARDNEDGGSMSMYVFHKSKKKGAEWRIADVD